MASKPEQEPSIEEILASIRQIISDDDQPREADIDLSAPEEASAPVVEPEPVQEAPKSSFADVLELTNEIPAEEPKNVSLDDIDAMFAEPAAPVKAPEPEPVFAAASPPPPPPPPAPKVEAITPFPPVEAKADPADSIFGNIAAEATTQAFSKLVGNIPVEREENRTMYADGRVTLEDITRDLLKPMLRDWINAHVPSIVERLVEKELEKLARQARDQ